MRKLVNFNDWERKKIYDVFSVYDDPYTGIITKIDVTNLVLISKDRDCSFYGLMVYMILNSMIQIEAFLYGYGKHDGELDVYCYDDISATMTILDINGMLNFTRYVKYNENMDKFLEEFEKVKKDAFNQVDYYKIDNLENYNKVNITCMPWVNFTSFKDAINYKEKSSKPKICWDKFEIVDGKTYLNLSLLVNHAFQDGYHMGLLINILQEKIQQMEVNVKRKELVNDYDKRKRVN